MAYSGVQLEDFKDGWALVGGTFGCGHYFRRVGTEDLVLSSCGQWSRVGVLFGIGTFPACKRCEKKHGAPPDTRTFVELEREGRKLA